MLKTENWEVSNFGNAILGMRNPKDSWAKSDSTYAYVEKVLAGFDENTGKPAAITVTEKKFILGPNDMDLAVRLCKGGSVHRKFMRQIFISVDITAPLYWWKEFDTYKVATVANSCSTMYTITNKPITMDLISCDKMSNSAYNATLTLMYNIEATRQLYLQEKDPVKKKQYWYDIIQMLPSSWNQRRTITMNYETLFGILRDRSNHKQEEWHVLCDDIVKNCPYVKELVVDVLEEQTKKTDDEKDKTISDLKKVIDMLEIIIAGYKNKYGNLEEKDIAPAKEKMKEETKMENIKSQVPDTEKIVAMMPISNNKKQEIAMAYNEAVESIKNKKELTEENNK